MGYEAGELPLVEGVAMVSVSEGGTEPKVFASYVIG